MRVALVCPRSAAGVVGGFERLWEGLAESINTHTQHEASMIGVASPESTLSEVILSYTKFARLRLDEYDVVITGKYPAWMVRHRCHVIHMAHPLRGLYDGYPEHALQFARPESVEGRQLIEAVRTLAVGVDQSRQVVTALAQDFATSVAPDHPDHALPGPLAREVVRWFDSDALHPRRIAKYTALSSTVAKREGYFPLGADVEVIVPPTGLDGLRSGPHRSIFTASRLDHPKRIDLIVDAMKHVTVPCSLRIAGTGPAESALRDQARHDDRIEFLGLVDDHQLVDEYANALVVPFVPRDEDLGLVTIEAHMSAKPVITCTDSGGVVEMVAHGVDGFVVEPTPEALGAALSTLVLDPELAARMGQQGRQKAQELTYPRMIERLLDIRSQPAEQNQRPRVVVFNTYEAEPARHGGQVRASRLLRELASAADVLYIAVTDSPVAKNGSIVPGLRQLVVRPSPRSKEVEAFLAGAAGVPVGDAAALLGADPADELMQLAAIETKNASAIILVHPFLYPLIRDVDPAVPVIYDAQNVESALKTAVYPENAVGAALAAAVTEAEAATVRRATLVTAVSDEDVAALQSLTNTLASFVVVPNGVDVDATEFVTGAERRIRRNRWFASLCRAGWDPGVTDVAVFVGSAHPPNVEAAMVVLSVAERLPDVLFVLAGTHSDALGRFPRSDNVIARGVVGVDEMHVLLSMCTVALNPMCRGSGTNIKMLDYFAAGAPTIATPIGARGLGAEHGVNLLLAATPDGLVDAIREICADAERGTRLAAAARHLAQQNNWADLGRRYAEHVLQALAD